MTKGFLIALGAALGACAPNFSDEAARIDGPRLIAVLVEPPELRPGDELQLTPVIAGGAAPLSYRFCTVPSSPTDPRPVADACFDEAGLPLTPEGDGARGRLPTNACSLFGPNPTSARLRPPDADATGGYYQPIVVEGLVPSVVLVRMLCPLPDVSSQLSRELGAEYRLNENPELAGLEPAEAPLRRGSPQALRVTWPARAEESFWWIPPGSSALSEQHETLRVSWFAWGGRWQASATRGETSETLGSASNTLTPDADAASVELWAVLRDSRGGQSAKHWRLPVEP